MNSERNSQYFIVAMLTGATHVTTLYMTVRTESTTGADELSDVCGARRSHEDVIEFGKLCCTRHVAVRPERWERTGPVQSGRSGNN